MPDNTDVAYTLPEEGNLMTSDSDSKDEVEEGWRDFLIAGDFSRERNFRNIFAKIPDGPRCKVCNAPYHGVGAPLMRVLGRTPSNLTPHLCNW